MVLSEGSGKVLLVSTRLFQEVSETIYKLKTFRIFWPGEFRAFAMKSSRIPKRNLMIRKLGLGINYFCIPDQYLSDPTAHSYLLQEVHREAEANKVLHSACIEEVALGAFNQRSKYAGIEVRQRGIHVTSKIHLAPEWLDHAPFDLQYTNNLDHHAGGKFALLAKAYTSFEDFDPDFAWLANLEGWNTLLGQTGASIMYSLYAR
ncbi:hypothetical protein HBI37_216930 [Parastagonospora nodorum]|nr:hypothetical protein HBH49_235210 [Parastagonospora nodorum]KAH5531232.1 hypothetical protein HBI27_220530 [Parastagonospora nodorum]KAH6325201.1 hypothetical protein HBI37_216930 [Parastagonospora nodorum]